MKLWSRLRTAGKSAGRLQRAREPGTGVFLTFFKWLSTQNSSIAVLERGSVVAEGAWEGGRGCYQGREMYLVGGIAKEKRQAGEKGTGWWKT